MEAETDRYYRTLAAHSALPLAFSRAERAPYADRPTRQDRPRQMICIPHYALGTWWSLGWKRRSASRRWRMLWLVTASRTSSIRTASRQRRGGGKRHRFDNGKRRVAYRLA